MREDIVDSVGNSIWTAEISIASAVPQESEERGLSVSVRPIGSLALAPNILPADLEPIWPEKIKTSVLSFPNEVRLD